MPLKWHECSDSLGQCHRAQIGSAVAAVERGKTAEHAKRMRKAQRKVAKMQGRKGRIIEHKVSEAE